jgi:hypothetical protein
MLSLSYPSGISTFLLKKKVAGLHRACPSAALDKSHFLKMNDIS